MASCCLLTIEFIYPFSLKKNSWTPPSGIDLSGKREEKDESERREEVEEEEEEEEHDGGGEVETRKSLLWLENFLPNFR